MNSDGMAMNFDVMGSGDGGEGGMKKRGRRAAGPVDRTF